VRAALVVILALAAGQAAAADRPADRQMELKAREAYAAGRYDEALNLYAKLYAETLHPVYLRNIGRCHQKLREPQKAIDAFIDYLGKSKKISPEEKAEIEGYIHEMDLLRQQQQVQKPVEPAPPAPPPPAAAPPPPTAPVMLTAAPGPAPASEEAPVYKKWWFWTIIGAVAVGGVVTALMLSSGTDRPACPSGISCQ
jgi:tetratricopeptide (TPR) repeat protein